MEDSGGIQRISPPASPELTGLQPAGLAGEQESLRPPPPQGPPGLQGGVQGEVVGEGAVEAEPAAVLQDCDVGRVSGGQAPLPHPQLQG